MAIPSKKQRIDNYVTKIFHESNTGTFDIFTYIDIDKYMSKEEILGCLETIVQKNPVLKEYIQKENDTLFLVEDTDFDIQSYCTIHQIKKEDFQSYMDIFLNEAFSTPCKWKVNVCCDTATNTIRIAFKIDHAYADGYQVIKILTSAFTDEDPTKKFKHSTTFFNSIYALVFGTLSLLSLNIKFLVKCLTNEIQDNYVTRDTETLQSEPLSLADIKQITKKYNITVNDFLYACMVKTDYLYTNNPRTITSASPINVSRTKDLNNVMPLFLSMQTDLDTPTLFHKVHSMFDACKYSAFTSLLSILINTATPLLSMDILTRCYDVILSNCDYVYSNIIGPDLKTISIPVSNIHFATIAKNNEIVFNIISCNDTVNIVCSFKKGRIEDKAQFKTCIEEAYKSLLAS